MTQFELPIALLPSKTALEPELVRDLELVATTDEARCLYHHVFSDTQTIGARTINRWAGHYTKDRGYIKDTQRLLRKTLPSALSPELEEGILAVWSAIERRKTAGDDVDGFHGQYQYIDWPSLKWLNKHAAFLTCLSAYNIGSPVLSLATPIFMLLIPFVALKLTGRRISLHTYVEVLKVSMKSHALGKLFNLNQASKEEKVYIAVSVAFYLFQVYQNIRSCIQFCGNMKTVRNHLVSTREFLQKWIEDAEKFQRQTGSFKSYKPFHQATSLHVARAREFLEDIPSVTHDDHWGQRALGIGADMKSFYAVHQDEAFHETLGYALDWTAYLVNMRNVQALVKSGRLNRCTLSRRKTKFEDAYFPGSGEDPVRNTYSLDRHLLVTGPNAAGKTTILKATLFNILLSQQLGVGFYKRARICPFDKIHCYINIPDTSGRDSLFQAEARRCKNILAAIERGGPSARHFCVFDELYSGTNPYEAIGSAEAFLRYIGNNKRVSFVMTTHFLDLCARLDEHERVRNCHMDATASSRGMEYTYKLRGGVSRVKGGVEVLKALAYPSSVVEGAQDAVESMASEVR